MSNHRFNGTVERSREGDRWIITGDTVKDGVKYLTVRKTHTRKEPVDYYMRESDYLRTDYFKVFIPISGRV